MSAFCVFGVTKPVAKMLALKKAPPKEIREQGQDAYDEWLEEQINTRLEKAKVRQVSPEFCAPQFCHDWIDLAKRTAGGTRLQIMARAVKTDKNGAPVISKATGRPLMSWAPYKP